MTQIYQSFAFAEDDTVEQRMQKLYLGVISVGEDLYCKGSAVAELAKQLNQYETTIREMRQELASLKERRKLTTLQCSCGQEWLIDGDAIGKRAGG